MMAEIYDQRICELGEGPLWHPERGQLFWFDIMGKRLLTQVDGDELEWDFDEHVSAAGWTGLDTLLIASETALWEFDLSTGEQTYLHALEADNPVTRSNDGRADLWGGFWIGTMGKSAEPGAGAIYRYFRGELRKIIPNITISNSICFDGPGSRAFYSDTLTQKIMCVLLDPKTGWPDGPADVFVDLAPENLNPDGAVVDADGNVWVAEWGAFRVSCYAPDGTRTKTIKAPAAHCSCPAFGGPDLTDLYITTATELLPPEDLISHPANGMTFVARAAGKGVPEPKVIL